MFKKTLLAAGIIAASTSAFALTVTGDASNYSYEALASGAVENNGGELTLPKLKVALGATYTVGDEITITLAGGEFNTGNKSFKLADLTTAGSGGSGKDKLTFGFRSKTDNSVTFQVVSKTETGSGNTLGNEIQLTLNDDSAVLVKLDSVTVGAQVAATSSSMNKFGSVLEAVSKAHVIGEVKNQFTIKTAAPLNVDADVSKDRKVFVTTGNTDNTIDVTYATAKAADGTTPLTFVEPLSVSGKYTITVTGDFTAFDGSADSGKLSDGTNTYKVAEDKQSASYTYTGVGTKTLTFTTAAKDADRVVIPVSDYTVSVQIEDVADKYSMPVVGATANKIGLNGYSADVPALPLGDSVQQFLWVTNNGSIDGEITITALGQDGKEYGPFEIGTSTKGMQPIGADVAKKLAEAGLKSGRAKLNVTVNAPEANISLYAGYKVTADADRLALNVVPLNK